MYRMMEMHKTYTAGATNFNVPTRFLVHHQQEHFETLRDVSIVTELSVSSTEQAVAIADACNKIEADHALAHEGQYRVVVTVEADHTVCVAEKVSQELAELIVGALVDVDGRIECIEA